MEAKTQKNTIEDFSIRLSQHFPDTKISRLLSVEINRSQVRVYLSDDIDNYLLGLASQLDKILLEKKIIKREGIKEIKQSLSKSYSAMTLYGEDIEKIIDVFNNDFTDCEITIDRYQIPDATHLDKAEARIKGKKIEDFSVRLSQYSPDTKISRLLSVEINRSRARVYLSDDTDNYLLGLASKLDRIFLAKKSIGRTLTNPKVWVPLISILLGTFIILLVTLPWKFSDHSTQSTTLMIITFLPLILTCIGIVFFPIIFIKGNVIYLEYSQNRTNFFKRNKDQIIFALTFGIIGVIVGAVLAAIILHAIYPPKP